MLKDYLFSWELSKEMMIIFQESKAFNHLSVYSEKRPQNSGRVGVWYYENNEVCRRNRTKQAIIIVIIMMVGFLATPIFALASDFCRFWQEIYKWQRESEKSLVSCFVSPPKIGIYSPKFELRVELHTVVRLWHVPFAEIQIVSQNDAHTLHNSRPTDSHHDDPTNWLQNWCCCQFQSSSWWC